MTDETCLIAFRTTNGFKKIVEDYADANDLTISQIARHAVRRFIEQDTHDKSASE